MKRGLRKRKGEKPGKVTRDGKGGRGSWEFDENAKEFTCPPLGYSDNEFLMWWWCRFANEDSSLHRLREASPTHETQTYASRTQKPNPVWKSREKVQFSAQEPID